MAGKTDRLSYGAPRGIGTQIARRFSGVGIPVGADTRQSLDSEENILIGEEIPQPFLFRPYAISTPPDGFGLVTPIFIENRQRIPQPHSHRTEVREGLRSTYLAKGNLFEQQVGISLAFKYPDALIVPQICLHVGPGRFEVRGDFLIWHKEGPSELVEVKLGRDREGISETLNKHNYVLSQKTAFPHIPDVDSPYYHLITLLSQTNNYSFRHEPFESILTGFDDPEMKLYMGEFGELLKNIPDTTPNADWFNAFLATFQTYLYNIVDRANQYSGEMRRAYLRFTMGELYEVWKGNNHRREILQGFLESKMDDTFSPYHVLEAHYLWNGQLYRGSIGVRQLQDEIHGDAAVVCVLDGIGLSPKARDLALLIEMSPHRFAFREFFKGYTGKIYRSPVFVLSHLPNPLKFQAITINSRVGDHVYVRGMRIELPHVRVIRDLTEVTDPTILGVSPEDFQWYMNEYRPYLDQLEER